MKTKLYIILIAIVMMVESCSGNNTKININRQSDDMVVINISNAQKYLLLPIQEDAPEAQVRHNTGSATDTWMDVRLAVSRID